MLVNLRSNFIFRRIFNNLLKRKKLQLLRRNKKFQKKLNITKKDFLEFKTLNQINQKYNLGVKDIEIEQLFQIGGGHPNKIIEDICKMAFAQLKELDLSENIISDIKELKNAKFEQLESLNLMDNKINDINIMEKVNFQQLKYLDFSGNEISDIKILEKVNFPNLET